MTASHFVYLMMLLNASASLKYLWQGEFIHALYWLCACGLNWCVIQMRG